MKLRSRSEFAPSCWARSDFLLRGRNCLGQDGRVPKLAKIRHGDSPMRHGAAFVLFGHALK